MADEWTTVRRRRNVVNVAEQAKALKRLPIPVVPLSFSALDVEENAIQKAQEAAEAEKKRLRKERQRAKAAEQAQAAHKEQQQQQRISTAKSASGSAAKAPSNSTPQPSGSTQDASTAGPYSGLLALLATIFGVSLIQQLIQQIKSLLGLGSSRPSKRRRQGPPGSQRVAGGPQNKEPAKDEAQAQPAAPATVAGTSARAPAAKDRAAAATTAQAAQPSIPAQGGHAASSGAAQGASSGPAGSAAPAAAATAGTAAGAAKQPAATQAAAQPSRNAKPASSEAARPPAPAPSKPPCDADWARGRFLVSEHPNAHADVISSLALSGDVALSSGYDGSIKVWHWPASGPAEHTRNLTGHSGRVEAVALETSATPRRAASSGRDSTLKVWDLGRETSVAASSYYVYESVRCMAVDWTSGSAALGCQSGSVALFDLERGRKLQAIKGAHSDEVCCLLHHSYGGSGQHLISGSRDACVAVWDLRSNPATSTAELEGLRGRVCSLAASDHLLYVGDYSSTVKVFDLRLGSQPQPAFCLPNVPVFAGDACPVAGLHCDGTAGVIVSSSIGWWTANKQALEEAPQDASEPIAGLNVHAACKPGTGPASGTAPAIPKHEYLYTLRLCTGIATCLAASPGLGSGGGARMLMGTSNGTLVGLSLVKGSGNRVQVPDGVALEEGLPIGVEQLLDEDEDSDDDDEA